MAPPTESTGSTENADKEQDGGLGTQSSVETVGPCKRRIKAEVPAGKVEEELDRNYKELISSVQIPGFRRGRVPRRLIEKRYGGEIEGDVKESLLGLSFAEAVKEKDLKVLGKPKFENITFKVGEPLRYEVEVEVRPEFELASYTGVEVEAPEAPAVPAEEIDAQLENLRGKYAELVAVDPAQAGADDIYIGHYVLLREGLRVHSKEEVRFRPSGKVLDGIEVPDLPEKVAARGQSPSFKLELKVPDHYSEEVLRGSQVELEFTVEEIKRVQLPAIDDELAKRYDEPSLADLRSKIQKGLSERKRRHQEEELEVKILDRISEGVQFEMPEGLLEEQLKMQKVKLQFALLQEGRSQEDIEAELKKVDEKSAGEEIRRDFKRFFILEKIAEEEKIFATEDEVSDRVHLMAHAYGQTARAVWEELESSDRLETLRAEIRHAKVRKFLREKAKLVGTNGSAAPPPAEPPAASTEGPAAEGAPADAQA